MSQFKHFAAMSAHTTVPTPQQADLAQQVCGLLRPGQYFVDLNGMQPLMADAICAADAAH
ncbi:MAG: hypothetical protein V4724_25030 [Pseudomonadota bacterium]